MKIFAYLLKQIVLFLFLCVSIEPNIFNTFLLNQAFSESSIKEHYGTSHDSQYSRCFESRYVTKPLYKHFHPYFNKYARLPESMYRHILKNEVFSF